MTDFLVHERSLVPWMFLEDKHEYTIHSRI